jgi:hypothetical protein
MPLNAQSPLEITATCTLQEGCRFIEVGFETANMEQSMLQGYNLKVYQNGKLLKERTLNLQPFEDMPTAYLFGSTIKEDVSSIPLGARLTIVLTPVYTQPPKPEGFSVSLTEITLD